MTVNIICTGKLKEDYLRDACSEYVKRLGAFCKLNVIELKPAPLPDSPEPSQIEAALENEAERILAKAGKSGYIISLCIEGKQFSSEELSAEMEKLALNGDGTVSFIIGSSYGLSEKIKAQSKLKLSMSRMTFPHQLARVMLLEQIYRAFMISGKGKYHK